MKKSICALALTTLASLFVMSGCGGQTKEEATPTTGQTMTPDEEKHYEDQMEKMKEYQKSLGNK